MLKCLSMTFLAIAALSTIALAAKTHIVVMEHGSLSTIEIDARVGDCAKFLHKDNVGVHALYLADEQHSFDLSDMKHGYHFDLDLKHSGI